MLTPDVPRFFVRLQHAGWTPSQLLEICHASERLDYDGFSLYDVPSQPALECWTALSYCLGSTNRLVGVPLVLANPLRNPALVAKAAADLQTLSGGRLVLGLGAGGSDHDLRAYGLGDLPLRRRLEWLDEALQLIRQLLTGRQHSHRGTRYAVEGLHVDLPPAPLPILVGGHGQRLLQIAARHADIVNVGFDLTPEEWYRVKNLLERRRLEAPQRETRLVLSHNISVPHAEDVDSLAVVHRLVRAGVSWFFLLFQDLPELTLLERFSKRVLLPFRTEGS